MKKLLLVLILLLNCSQVFAYYSSVYTPTGAYDVYVGEHYSSVTEKTSPELIKLKHFLDDAGYSYNEIEKREILKAFKPILKTKLDRWLSKSSYYS